jgi:hypothetical protein
MWRRLESKGNYDDVDGFQRFQSQEKRPSKGLLTGFEAGV